MTTARMGALCYYRHPVLHIEKLFYLHLNIKYKIKVQHKRILI